MGAWIEILISSVIVVFWGSHPSWVRGLKLLAAQMENYRGTVAPLVGAWIEILRGIQAPPLHTVAPLVGAWIEIAYNLCMTCSQSVAPLVGAWIEIYSLLAQYGYTERRTPRGCVD